MLDLLLPAPSTWSTEATGSRRGSSASSPSPGP